MSAEDLQARLERWESRLRSLTTQTITSDYVRPDPPRVVEAVHEVVIPDSVRIALLQLGIIDLEDPFTPFTTLLTAFTVLAARLTGDEDIALGTSNEHHEPFVLRTPLTPKTSFRELLKKVQTAEYEATEDEVPFQNLLTHLQAKSKTGSPPALFKLALYHAPDAPSQQFLSTYQLTNDLTIFVELGPLKAVAPGLRTKPQLREIKLRAHYNQLIFSTARIQFMVDQLLQIVTEGSKNPDIAVGSISLITPSQKALLPDPTTDLHWGNFRGAIHDIFSANAKKHPERECIVETADFTNPQSKNRVFTYKQIDEASNILAHHLVAKGIKLGDVVMVYAYRGVDLVVAVMGVLKAGATFSVIDPAYPPARQNIYLQVAQPKALVVIEKAGTLAKLVREFIEEKLSILTEVPALAIQDDGSLLGGQLDGADVLAEQVSLKSQGTDVVVGPDSNPTLSFTSGSEGIPKGVRGRHFSLTYYFPWMAETFGLSENDRFTMLSGIAHDPIQRDIFTPLFLGAKLLVPTADDIGTPGRLAEWMADNGATITHLTPAMGQLLSAQATRAIPSLHHAFFVGDILTKRDCLRLQSLARNVAVVNMYGTTETQRAVSYFEVPSLNKDSTFSQSQKDVIAAGKGMLDVQLLVVNRNDREQVCGVGEIGEIYVRAAGLAEGYLQLPDMTALKFVKNWYVPENAWVGKADAPENAPWKDLYFGPRDRMYRTGDLGRYTPNGDVECSGRADDQVKIRGFRIELGEIDTHLSQHPLVRENVTLVRRDKDEEPTLVSYIVPLQGSSLDELVSATEDEGHDPEDDDPIVHSIRKHRKLIKEVKEYLKKKLPSYAVPTVVVPLARLPLNPNGKVDKPALPFPDTAQLAAAHKKRSKKLAVTGGKDAEEATITLTPTQKELQAIWTELLPHATSTIGPEDDFFEIGGHSILATRMIFEVRKRFVTNINLGAIFKCPTLGALAGEIDRLRGSGELGIQGIDIAHEQEEPKAPTVNYAEDAKDLARTKLPKSFPNLTGEFDTTDGINVFLTGATGFLGVFLLRDVLTRTAPLVKKVVAHVRAKTPEAGLARIQSSCEAYGVWDNAWTHRLEIVTGDLGAPKLGLDDATWARMTEEIDVVIHNGAQVHWVYPYATLRGPNVIGTIDALELCASGKAKSFTFVSSTSTLDTDYFVQLSDKILQQGGVGISEADDLSGSAKDLGNGYGQSKWAAEYLVREAGRRGLAGFVVRPGYIVGDSASGTTNTDDFLVRMLKGCVQLGRYPDIFNTVNMVPVDHVSRVVTACAFNPAPNAVVAHVTSHPRLRMNEFLAHLATYGFDVTAEDYIPWRMALEQHVVNKSGNDNALFPLLHFVLDNLPASTKAPELDDQNAVQALTRDIKYSGVDVSKGRGVGDKEMGIYLAWLVNIGFLPEPQGEGKKNLPELTVSEAVKEARANVGGRGALV